jgi:hypothetical protein
MLRRPPTLKRNLLRLGLLPDTRQMARWVTHHGADDQRPQLDPAELVRSKGTMCSLSKESMAPQAL